MSYGYTGLYRHTRPNGPGGTVTDWFVRDPDGKLLAMVENSGAGTVRYYLTDAQDSVVGTFTVSDGSVRRYLYEPYGEQVRSWIDATPGGNTSTGTTPPDGSQGALTTADTAADANPLAVRLGVLRHRHQDAQVRHPTLHALGVPVDPDRPQSLANHNDH